MMLLQGKPKVVKDGNLFYIYGTPSHWNFYSISLDKKEKSRISLLKNIVNLSFTKDYLAVESDMELSLIDYDGITTKIPFDCKLVGKYKDLLLIEDGERIYFLKGNDLIKKIETINQKYPKKL